MGTSPPPPTSPAAAAIDIQLLHVLRQQNITQSRVWRGVLVTLGMLLAVVMWWQLHVLPSSTLDGEGLVISMHYVKYMCKLAAVGYIGEASLVLWSREPAVVQWTTRFLVVATWLVSEVLHGWWQHQEKAFATEAISSTYVAAIVMGPRFFAASCWLARRELRALDSDLEKLDRIAPS
ncbi:hypothetical protein H310_14531 [Aphanomyces invadans]|uniref:Uncharacterized protein n=1 Tax=Aphanomyces invadans TaxID=157072 RepID=A0A024T9M2_9STRA|nr:hypothetical protein H310_14531 [Aphanomyces invadans]ETV90743.1 hypothetical protein H310_14531 [Aphanomyces invadans]|eukprot:XP_008880633.1 hypothetical protein H310_14531 [Aphanomyces invadans]